jgi:hypothetical protein
MVEDEIMVRSTIAEYLCRGAMGTRRAAAG